VGGTCAKEKGVSRPIDTRDALFVDSEVRVFEGEEARQRLAETNDGRFLEGARGVVRVDRERWTEAQRYERRTWMENERLAADDHNREYLLPFRGYEALRDATFERGIELGCGPFTNLRLILERTRVREIHLLDPLIPDYLHHPFCRYRGARLGGIGAVLPGAMSRLRSAPRGLLAEMWNLVRIGGLRGRPVELHPTAIEDLRPGRAFDLVVMINVLEHCRDADEVFSKILEILAPGGVLVFRDRLWDPGELTRTIRTLYDAGHPLRVGRSAAEPFLAHFDPIHRQDDHVVDVEDGLRLERTAVSFIGRKRS
jgi:SAM-dependent methyltransferase